METYMPMLKDTLGMFLFLGVELSVLFIIISAGVSLLQQYVPDSKVQKLLGAEQGRGYILAATIGAITPFCTCSTIPMLRGLLRAKAGFGSTLTFLFASPLLNPIIIGLFVVTFGIKVTITYTIIALVVSIVAGIILKYMNFERYILEETNTATTSCCGTQAKDKVIDIKPLNTNNMKQSVNPQATSATCCTSKNEDFGIKPFAVADNACCTNVSSSAIPQDDKVSETCCSTENEKPTLKSFAMDDTACCTSQNVIPQDETASCCENQNANSQDETASCCASQNAIPQASSSCCASTPKPVGDTFKQKCKVALIDGYGQFKAVLPYLLLGISLGAVIYGFVPSDFIVQYASGDSIFAVPIAAIIGIPLYIRVEALIPLSEVLVSKGMGLGPVMALIIGGGGASLTEVILLKSMFKTPVIIAFLIVILTMAVGAGYLFQFFF